jgi:hypothetical protein
VSDFQGPFTDLRQAGVTGEEILLVTEIEKKEVDTLAGQLFDNVLRRERTAVAGHPRASLRDEMAQEFAKTGAMLPERSQIVYVACWELKASDKIDFAEALERLKVALDVEGRLKELVLVGDQQTWKQMVDLKNDFQADYKWLYPLPGDWHTLLNAQPVFKKVFMNAGLLNMASKMGYTEASAVGALAESANFRRNHLFLIETWEAVYWVQLKHFLSDKGYERAFEDLEELQSELGSETMQAAGRSCPALPEPRAKVEEVLTAAKADLRGLEAEFQRWGEELGNTSKTWAFWWRFVHVDMQGYLALWLAIQTGNWDLKVAAYKLLGPMFRAYDRTHYQQLIPLHLAHLHRWPPHIVEALRQGVWSVSLNGRPFRSLAIDEAHKSCINRDLKMALARIVGQEALVLKVNWLPQRALILKPLMENLEFEKGTTNLDELAAGLGAHRHLEVNIQEAVKFIWSEGRLREPVIVGAEDHLVHLFSGQHAMLQPELDLLNFRKIGEDLLLRFVRHSILRAPMARRRAEKKQYLLGFLAAKKASKKKADKQVAEAKRRELVLKRLVDVWRKDRPFDRSLTITNPVAQALFTVSGEMRKGAKSLFTRHLVDDVFPECLINYFPRVRAVILEGQFMIPSTPLVACKDVRDYAIQLVKQYVLAPLSSKCIIWIKNHSRNLVQWHI